MKRCNCKRFLWIKFECEYCKKKRIASNRKWHKEHTFVYGEDVVVSSDFVGQGVKGIIMDQETIYHSCHEQPIMGYTEINYQVKLPDGYIKKFSRYNIRKMNK